MNTIPYSYIYGIVTRTIFHFSARFFCCYRYLFPYERVFVQQKKIYQKRRGKNGHKSWWKYASGKTWITWWFYCANCQKDNSSREEDRFSAGQVVAYAASWRHVSSSRIRITPWHLTKATQSTSDTFTLLTYAPRRQHPPLELSAVSTRRIFYNSLWICIAYKSTRHATGTFDIVSDGKGDFVYFFEVCMPIYANASGTAGAGWGRPPRGHPVHPPPNYRHVSEKSTRWTNFCRP